MPDGSLLEFAQLDNDFSIDGDRERSLSILAMFLNNGCLILHTYLYREKSSLVWQELMEVVLGLEFVTMKREKGMLC